MLSISTDSECQHLFQEPLFSLQAVFDRSIVLFCFGLVGWLFFFLFCFVFSRH